MKTRSISILGGHAFSIRTAHHPIRFISHRRRQVMGGRGQCAFVFALCLVAITSALGAPYPKEGMLTKWVQPDGTSLTLRVFGDEFYGRTTTKDGYTLVFDPANNTYYYAKAGAGGKSLVSSGIKAQHTPPEGLVRHLQEPRETVAAIRAENMNKFAVDRQAVWRARVKAVQIERARAAGPSPTGASTASASSNPLAAAVTGNRVGLMILVQFPDDPATGTSDPVNFPATAAKAQRFCNEAGYTDDGNTGSIRDYYYDQSNGQLTFTHLVSFIVTLPHPRNYYNYSNYPTNSNLPDCGTAGRMLVADAISELKKQGFDFSTLSIDSSNNVVATSLLFAGSDSGVWAKGLWPHSWVTSPPVNVGTTGTPRYIYHYQIANAATSALVIGTSCHEIGHMLMGYPDFYDYGGDSEGVGNHCLMAAGNHLNSGKTPAPIDLYLKDFSGWANITDLTPTQILDSTLPSTGNRGYRIRKPGTDTEYFLVENRGTGDKWAVYCPDKGIAIWHVDETVSGNDNQQMTPTQHYELSLEQADGYFDMESDRNRGDSADLFDNGGLLSNGTSPNADWWSGTASGISILVNSTAGASMNVRFGSGTPTATLSANPNAQSVPAAGGTYSFAVNSSTTWSWSDNASWVTSSEANSQSGNQTFTYTVAANTGTASRVTVITLSAAGGLIATHTITQVGVSVDDHGNSMATATLIAQNSSTNGSIETGGDADYFRINVIGSGTLTVETTGTTDTYGYLLDASGNQLASDDDTGIDTNFRISYTVTAGTYYVWLRHYYSTETGSYVLVSSLTTNQTLSVNPTTQSVLAAGGTYNFGVNSSTAWSWSDNASWVTSNEAASQSGSQTFTYTVAANTGTASRVAVITLSTAGGLMATYTITQVGASVDDHGNNIATATLIAQNSSTNGSIETSGDADYFRINVIGSGTLTVETTGATDTYGYLLDASGNQLASDDDTGIDTNFRIGYTVTTGTYYVCVEHYSSTGTGSYVLVASGFSQDDHGNSMATATLIAQNSSTNGSIETGGDADYFRINVIGSGTLTVETTGATDTYGYLLDASGNQLASDDDTGIDTNFRIGYTVTTGTYYVWLRHYYSTETGSYVLQSSFSGTTAPEIAVEQPAGTNLVDGGATVPFGNVLVGANASLTFTVRNTGSASLTGIAASFSGGNSTDFAVTASPATTVAAGNSTTFTVRFTSGGTGNRTTTLRVASNDADENPFDITLTGTGQAPEIAVEQPAGTNLVDGGATVPFGNVLLGANASLTFTVRNTGSASLTGISTSVSGGNSTDFAVTASPATTLSAGGNTTFTVRFTPGATGNRTTTLRVASNDADENPFDITLSGVGTSASVDSDSDGVKDAWETANGFNPHLANDVFTLDSDHDGNIDLQEIFQGTNRNSVGERFGMQNTNATVSVSTQVLKTRYRRSTTQTAVSGSHLWSTDLVNWYATGQTVGGVTVTISEAQVGSGTGYQIMEVTVRVTAGTPGRLFYTLDLQPND